MTTAALSDLRGDTEEMGVVGDFEVEPDHFIFASELPGIAPPHPDAMSHAFSRCRRAHRATPSR
jgi:hypothetical protein